MEADKSSLITIHTTVYRHPHVHVCLWCSSYPYTRCTHTHGCRRLRFFVRKRLYHGYGRWIAAGAVGSGDELRCKRSYPTEGYSLGAPDGYTAGTTGTQMCSEYLPPRHCNNNAYARLAISRSVELVVEVRPRG